MSKPVYVTSAQVRAAKTLVRRSAITGRVVSPAVQKIADAQKRQPTPSPRPSR